MATVDYYTDPACPWSWALEPSIRKLGLEFGELLEWRLVMSGLGRNLRDAAAAPQARARLVETWLRVADQTGAPLDPLLWVDGPIATTYPACMAVKAAVEQAPDAGHRYLRRLREGLMCERRKLDHAEALIQEAQTAGLDVERFRLALRSHAITEAFGDDLERAKRLGEEAVAPASHSTGAGGAPLPSLVFRGEDGGEQRVSGYVAYQPLREAAAAACGGAADAPVALSVEEAIASFGRVTTAEVEALCELPGPRAGAELYRLAEGWKVRQVRTLTGSLWEAA